MNMRTLRGDEPTGTDAEACAYLCTAALTQPMDHAWGQKYLYVANKTYSRWRKNEVPEDIRVESLNNYQTSELNRLKAWLYRQRTRVRQESERAERRRAKEEAGAQKKAEQPALFQF